MNIHYRKRGNVAIPAGSASPAPLDEELPPELPKQPAAATDTRFDAAPMLRELLSRIGASASAGRVLAVLDSGRPLQAGVVSRAGLAEICGYRSELEFFEESEPIVSVISHAWFATPDKRRGGWVLWCAGEPRPASSIHYVR